MKTLPRVSYFSALMVLAYGCAGTRAPRGPLDGSSPPPRTGQSCSPNINGPGPGPQPKITEGITGVVCFWKGDFMPGDGARRGVIEPVRRTIEIHAATLTGDAVAAADPGPFWTSVSTPLIATVTSGDDGWFEVAVPPGTYSLFVRESGRLYANGVNGDDIITAIEVVGGAVSRTQFDINYEATY